jgi:hypothetical protein
MEAQYGLQKKKPLIPLMLTQGYEADGWLGLLLGTSMWYAFHGETLSSTSAFESRMESLAREIGVRGRADALVVEPDHSSASDAQPEPEPQLEAHSDDTKIANRSNLPATQQDTSAIATLRALRLTQLRARAAALGVGSDVLEDALDSDDPKAAVVQLLLDAESKSDGGRRELEALRLKELRARAKQAGYSSEQLDEAADSDDPKAAVVELLLSPAPKSVPQERHS